MNDRTQELIALTIVGVIVLDIVWRTTRWFVSGPLAQFYLKRGKVKTAMRLRAIQSWWPRSGSPKKGCH